MIFAFQDLENLYLVLDFQNGGDLRYHQLKNRKSTKFNEEQASFYSHFLLNLNKNTLKDFFWLAFFWD